MQNRKADFHLEMACLHYSCPFIIQWVCHGDKCLPGMNRQTHFTSWPSQIWMQVGMWGKNAAEPWHSLVLLHQFSPHVSPKRKFIFYCFISASQTLEYNISRGFCTAMRIFPTHKKCLRLLLFWHVL